MLVVKLTDITIPPDRQRTLNLRKEINELMGSIERLGNLQRPGIWKAPDGTLTLVWGERRYTAILRLAAEGRPYKLGDGTPVPLGYIAVDPVEEVLTQLDRAEREFDENVVRVDLAWPDRVRALSTIHKARAMDNPKQTIQQTAVELSNKTGISVSTFNKAPTFSAKPGANSIPTALILSEHLADPEVQRATTVVNALAIVTRKREEAATAALLAKRVARGAMSGELVTLKHGDARVLIKDIPNESVDLILVDPPYGINADEPNFSRKQAQKHTYVDDPESAKNFMQFLLLESFRVAKTRANLFMFFDSKHMEWLYATASRALWSGFPVPIIWDKLAPGLGPWQINGFGRSYEMIFYATKGRKGTLSTIRDVIGVKRVPDEARRHPAQKPVDLLKILIELTTLPGEMILDPCCGSGATLFAARETKRRAVGFELDKALYDGAMTQLFGSTVNV